MTPTLTPEQRANLGKLVDLAGGFHTEGYAVLREARRAGHKTDDWPRISPTEAKAITDDLHRANELADAVRAIAKATSQ